MNFRSSFSNPNILAQNRNLTQAKKGATFVCPFVIVVEMFHSL